MSNEEMARNIQNVCRRDASVSHPDTVAALVCFVESIQRSEREECVKICEEIHGGDDDAASGLVYDCISAIRMRSNAGIQPSERSEDRLE